MQVAEANELCNDATEFILFRQLPQEIQDRIWGAYILLKPRIVELERDRASTRSRQLNGPPGIVDINQDLRKANLSLYGYQELIVPSRSLNIVPRKLTFHPDVDLLYIPRWYWLLARQGEFKQALRDCGAFETIRCIAMDYIEIEKEDFDDLKHFLLAELVECPSLELILLSLAKKSSLHGWKQGVRIRFEEMSIDADYRWSIAGCDHAYPFELQELWHTATQDSTPHIALVEKRVKVRLERMTQG